MHEDVEHEGQDVPKAQLSADHLGIAVVPLVVADRAPPSCVKHLHTSFKVLVPSDQPQRGTAA